MKTQTALLTPGSTAPDFDLPLASGGRITRAKLLEGGRRALLVFFKTECPTCKLAFPFLQRLYERAKRAPSPAGFLAVGQNPASELPAFFLQYGATFPAASDAEPYPVSGAYGLENVPTAFLIDEHGVVLRSVVGFSRREFDELAAALAGETGSLFTDADASVPVLQPG